jgi:hypothetical protein
MLNTQALQPPSHQASALRAESGSPRDSARLGEAAWQQQQRRSKALHASAYVFAVLRDCMVCVLPGFNTARQRGTSSADAVPARMPIKQSTHAREQLVSTSRHASYEHHVRLGSLAMRHVCRVLLIQHLSPHRWMQCCSKQPGHSSLLCCMGPCILVVAVLLSSPQQQLPQFVSLAQPLSPG